jgi:cytochrome c-type protein NapB
MRKLIAFATALAAVATMVAGLSFAQQNGVKSLRGVQIDEPRPIEQLAKQDKQRFTRAYRQQPPLIPHAIEQYQIDKAVNQCLGCHDWTNAGDKNAPTLSMTHYLDREGRQGDQIAGTRWFCNQCHVPQSGVDPLVENTFVPSSGN